MVTLRSAGGHRDIGLGPGRRGPGAGLPAVERYSVIQQVEVYIEAVQTVGSEHAVQRSGKDARHIDRGDANPSPRYCDPTDGEVVQFYLAGLQTACDPAQLPIKLDLGPLGAETLGNTGCQDRRFGAGIEKHGYRHPVGQQGDDRRVAQSGHGGLSEPSRPAAARRSNDEKVWVPRSSGIGLNGGAAEACRAEPVMWPGLRSHRRLGGTAGGRSQRHRRDCAAEPSVHGSPALLAPAPEVTSVTETRKVWVGESRSARVVNGSATP